MRAFGQSGKGNKDAQAPELWPTTGSMGRTGRWQWWPWPGSD